MPIDSSRYDTNFALVVPGANYQVYVPITLPEHHRFTEMVFPDATHILPRYLVTLQARLLAEPNSQDFRMQAALREQEAQAQAIRERAQRQAEREAEARRQAEEAEAAQRRAEQEAQEALALEARTARQERDAFAQQKEELTHQLTLMAGEQDRVRQERETLTRENGALVREKDGMTQQIAALTERLRALEARPVTPVAATPTSTSTAAAAGGGGAAAGGGGAMVQVPRPVGGDIVIPGIARGFEEIYRRFVRGMLIYTDPESKRKIELPIRALANPLEGEFNLSQCGDSGQYLSINTGYRKGKKAANGNKVEIWLAPHGLIAKELATTARHFKPIMGDWNPGTAPVGLFWTWGGWDDMGWYDYLTNESMEQVSNGNLYKKYQKSVTGAHAARGTPPRPHPTSPHIHYVGRRAAGTGAQFHVSFVN